MKTKKENNLYKQIVQTKSAQTNTNISAHKNANGEGKQACTQQSTHKCKHRVQTKSEHKNVNT